MGEPPALTKALSASSGGAVEVRRLSRLYLFALVLIGLLALAREDVVAQQLADRQDNAVMINQAGRQRMLSQRIAQDALALVTASGAPAGTAP